MKTKNILIPIEFSENSYQTIDYITALFKNEVCVFYFLNVYKFNTGGLSAIEMLQADDEWFEKPKEDSEKQLKSLLDHYTRRENKENHDYFTISEGLSLIKAIEKHIVAKDVDLIVLTGDTKIGENIEAIVGKIRTCPVLVVPPFASVNKKLKLTVASNFQEEVRMFGIDRFLDYFKNTNFEINILALTHQDQVTDETKKNITLLKGHLENYSNTLVKLEFEGKSKRLKDYAFSNLGNIMCVVDKKPNVLRKLGFGRSKVISTLETIYNNPVLTIHQ